MIPTIGRPLCFIRPTVCYSLSSTLFLVLIFFASNIFPTPPLCLPLFFPLHIQPIKHSKDLSFIPALPRQPPSASPWNLPRYNIDPHRPFFPTFLAAFYKIPGTSPLLISAGSSNQIPPSRRRKILFIHPFFYSRRIKYLTFPPRPPGGLCDIFCVFPQKGPHGFSLNFKPTLFFPPITLPPVPGALPFSITFPLRIRQYPPPTFAPSFRKIIRGLFPPHFIQKENPFALVCSFFFFLFV